MKWKVQVSTSTRDKYSINKIKSCLPIENKGLEMKEKRLLEIKVLQW